LEVRIYEREHFFLIMLGGSVVALATIIRFRAFD